MIVPKHQALHKPNKKYPYFRVKYINQKKNMSRYVNNFCFDHLWSLRTFMCQQYGLVKSCNFYISMINLQPTLIGKLTNIRPLLTQDFERLYKAASDRDIWVQHPEPQRYERDFFKRKYFDSAIACKGGLIFENKQGEAIGCSRYYNYRQTENDIMIGYTFLVRSCWGSNYNHEIKHLMLTHIYQWVNTVYFTVGANNVRSRKAVDRIGGVLLTPQQEIQRKVVAPGSVVFEIRRENFKGLI